jgi:hypothetical protein
VTGLVLPLAIVASVARADTPSGDTPLPYRVERDQFTVTSGAIQARPAHRLSIDVPEVRAVLRSPTPPAAAIRFTYFGPTAGTKPLASGEVRRQLGLKLRAQDTCNVLYVMWHIEPDTKIAVSVKWNPGQRTHAQCGARGYANIRPRRAVPIPPILPGASRTLQAELRARDLTVRVDGAIVWDGTLPPEIADFDGPVGLRSDNAQFEFEYFVGGLARNSVAEPSTCQGARPHDSAVAAAAGR